MTPSDIPKGSMLFHTECYSLILTNLLWDNQWCILLGWFCLNQSTNLSQSSLARRFLMTNNAVCRSPFWSCSL